MQRCTRSHTLKLIYALTHPLHNCTEDEITRRRRKTKTKATPATRIEAAQKDEQKCEAQTDKTMNEDTWNAYKML